MNVMSLSGQSQRELMPPSQAQPEPEQTIPDLHSPDRRPPKSPAQDPVPVPPPITEKNRPGSLPEIDPDQNTG